MKYLNEKIEVTVPFSQTTEDNVYNYIITLKDNPIFYGSCFIPKGATSKTFVINNILQEYQFVNSCFVNPASIVNVNNSLYNKVEVSIGDSDTLIGSAYSDTVCFVNKYPVYKDYLGFQTHLKKWISDDSWEPTYAPFVLRLQGLQNTKSWKWEPWLVPHYPLKNTSNYSIIGCFLDNAIDGRLTLSCGTSISVNAVSGYITSFAYPLSTFYSTASDGQDIELSGVITSGLKFVAVCGVFDGCPAKYYLQWQDRLGSVQSQPFDGTNTVSFDYDTDTIKNSFGEKRVLNNEQTIKWKINTGWISEKLYPFYESIFVSPYLRLYDSENDISYSVLVTDKTFTEKTFANNSHKLFNLTLNIELNKTQKCLW